VTSADSHIGQDRLGSTTRPAHRGHRRRRRSSILDDPPRSGIASARCCATSRRRADVRTIDTLTTSVITGATTTGMPRDDPHRAAATSCAGVAGSHIDLDMTRRRDLTGRGVRFQNGTALSATRAIGRSSGRTAGIAAVPGRAMLIIYTLLLVPPGRQPIAPSACGAAADQNRHTRF